MVTADGLRMRADTFSIHGPFMAPVTYSMIVNYCKKATQPQEIVGNTEIRELIVIQWLKGSYVSRAKIYRKYYSALVAYIQQDIM